MLSSIFNATEASIDLVSILISSFVSIVLGFVIAYVHKKTAKYSKEFLITLLILPLLVQTVILMSSGNLGTSVAIVGAFSLVRFRSIPGTSREIISVFFAMTIGLMTGMGYLLFAALITFFIAFLLWIFSKLRIFDREQEEKILKILIPENLDYTTVFDDIFEKYLVSNQLEQVKTTNMGSMFDLSYRVVLNKEVREKDFIDELRTRNGNLKIVLTHPLEENYL